MRTVQKIQAFAGVAATIALFLFTAQTPVAVHAQAPVPGKPANCNSEQGLTYLCGFDRPEDVVNVGSTGLVLASGHNPPGHLYLIDPATGKSSDLIRGAAFRSRQDKKTYPGCPGPLNLDAFDSHGISLAETSSKRFSIYTTSHGEREAIEIYELDLRKAAPVLTWKGCVLLEQDGYFNSVARLKDGGFVTTRMRDKGGNMNVGGKITGRVFEWHPGGTLGPMAGTEMSLPNGIDVSPEGRYLFVTSSGTRELVRFDLSESPIGKRAVATPMGPDNIHWDGKGKLLIAGPNRVDRAACANPPCRTGWTVIEVDPETLSISRLGGADGTASLQRASAAIRVGKEIWVASNDDRIARFPVQ